MLKLKKTHLVILVVFLLIIITFQFRNYEAEKQISQDIQLAQEAQENNNKTVCDKIEDSLIRDLCYRDLFVQVLMKDISPETSDSLCNNIDDSKIKLVCSRLSFRPHMLDFTPIWSNNLSIERFNRKCDYGNKYYDLYCTYEAVNDSEECHILNDTRYIGECKFFKAISIASGVEGNTEEVINISMNFCNKISDRDWRAECFYLIADELAYLNNSVFAEDISNACKKSVEAFDYGCFDHVVFNMFDKEFRHDFCRSIDKLHKKETYLVNIISNLTHKEECYVALGEGTQFWDMEEDEAKNECRLSEEGYEGYCFAGIANRYENTSSKISFCNSLNESFQKICFDNAIHELARTFGATYNDKDLEILSSKLIDDCILFPKDYKIECLSKLNRVFEWEKREREKISH